MNMNINNNNDDDSSSGVSFYHDSSEDDNISYEEEIRRDLMDDVHIQTVAVTTNNNDTITGNVNMNVNRNMNNKRDDVNSAISNFGKVPILKEESPIVLPVHYEKDDQSNDNHDIIMNTNSIPLESSVLISSASISSTTTSITSQTQNSTRTITKDGKNNNATKTTSTSDIHTTTSSSTTSASINTNIPSLTIPNTEIQTQQHENQQKQKLKLQQLQKTKTILLSKLNHIQTQQIQTQSEIKTLQNSIQNKLSQYNILSHSKRQHSLSNYSSILKHKEWIENECENLHGMCVLHDVFYIFHRGYFSTINGLRLGMSAPTLVSQQQQQQQHQIQNQQNLIMNTISNTNQNQNFNSNNNLNNNNGGGGTNHTIDVPWHEINAGIGMIALLISTIQSRLHIRSRFEILPRGSTTKVCFHSNSSSNSGGLQENMFGATTTSTNNNHDDNNNTNNSSYNHHQEWDLHYQPTTFSFFARRHWNNALNILGYCLYEIVEEVKQRLEFYNHSSSVNGNSNSNSNSSGKNNESTTPTINKNEVQIIIPFDVELSGDWKSERSVGYVKIGGMDIGFHGDGIAWTKALRYVALDLKWIIAFVSKYVDE